MESPSSSTDIRRPHAAAALAALFVLLSLIAAAPAGAQQLDGIQLHPLWDGVTARDSARELDVVRGAGADLVRIDIAWSALELRGNGRWSRDYGRRIDWFLSGARSRGIRVIATLNETPCWASRAPRALRQGCTGAWWDRGVTRYPPRQAADYADAAAYVARRWGPQLTALEVWNEPNAPVFLRSPDPVRDYARLVRATYRPVKRVAPRLTVLAGALAQADGNFLAALYDRGRIARRYDAISYHPYTEGADPAVELHPRGAAWSFIDGTAWLHDVMTARGDARGELWATEAGASSCDRAVDPGCVSEATQAANVGAYVRVARRFPYLRALVIYNLRDKGADSRDRENRFGIVRRDLRPKPALGAFREAAR